MKLHGINLEKLKKLKKYKMMAFVPIACGVIALSGCSIASSNKDIKNDDIDDIYDPNIKNHYSQQEETRYPAKIFLQNVDLLENKDYVFIHNGEGYAYDILSSLYPEKYSKLDITYPTNEYIVSSKTFPEMNAKVNLEKGEIAYIYVDYLTKTITVEKELVLEGKSK